jgi:glycosyltransferase involved in cell wall biosynthesis
MMTSGAEILATQIAMCLDPDRFESIICSTRPSAFEHVAMARAAGVEVLELGRRSKLDLWKWAPLVRLLRSGRVDVVHAHKFGSNLWASVLSKFADIPVLLAHEHTWSFAGKPLRRLVDRELIARSAAVVVAVSEADREKMIEIEGIPSEKIRYVPNGIPDRSAGDRELVRARLGIPAEVPVVGTVCALRPQKAVDVALEAVASLIDEPDLLFLVVGDGPERARLEREGAALGGRAIFVGRVPPMDVAHYVAAMDVLVCSSSFEGTPLAVLEWMAAGKGIVATRVGGIPALIEDGLEGLLVPPNDPASLAGAIHRLLHEPDLRERLGTAARLRQQEEFRLDSTVDVLQQLYVSLYLASTDAAGDAGAPGAGT